MAKNGKWLDKAVIAEQGELLSFASTGTVELCHYNFEENLIIQVHDITIFPPSDHKLLSCMRG